MKKNLDENGLFLLCFYQKINNLRQLLKLLLSPSQLIKTRITIKYNKMIKKLYKLAKCYIIETVQATKQTSEELIMNPQELKDFLSRNKMTGNELAAKLGVHWVTVSRWRNWQEPIPKTVELALKWIEEENYKLKK